MVYNVHKKQNNIVVPVHVHIHVHVYNADVHERCMDTYYYMCMYIIDEPGRASCCCSTSWDRS